MGRSTLKTFIFAWLPCLIVLGLIPVIALSGEASCEVIGESKIVDLTTGDYSAEPAKFIYSCRGTEVITTKLSNLSSSQQNFDMGDGNITTIPANSSIDYSYPINCDGQTHRIYIKKIQTGFVQSGLILKIEPK
jgi:hypothetical protein